MNAATLGRKQWFDSWCYRKASQGLSMKTCWQHRGNISFPTGGSKAMIELFKAGRQSIEDDLHSGRPPVAVSEENVEEVGHLVMNELPCRSEASQRKCRYMMHPPKQFSFGISICSVCTWRRMPKCQIQNKGKFVRRRLVVFWTAPEDLLTRFSSQDETRVPHLVPESKNESYQWNHPAPRSPKKKKFFCICICICILWLSCEVSRQGDGDSVLGHWKTSARRLPGLWH